MFLAGKTEDSFVNIIDLLKIYNKATEARVLECEILLLEVSLEWCQYSQRSNVIDPCSTHLQGLEFNLKVFHPQNCLYSIIADIKRREQTTIAALASSGTNSDPAAGEARRQLVSDLLHRWQATCEEYLIIVQVNQFCARNVSLCPLRWYATKINTVSLTFDCVVTRWLQCSSLVRQVNALSLALSVMKVAGNWTSL